MSFYDFTGSRLICYYFSRERPGQGKIRVTPCVLLFERRKFLRHRINSLYSVEVFMELVYHPVRSFTIPTSVRSFPWFKVTSLRSLSCPAHPSNSDRNFLSNWQYTLTFISDLLLTPLLSCCHRFVSRELLSLVCFPLCNHKTTLPGRKPVLNSPPHEKDCAMEVQDKMYYCTLCPTTPFGR